MFWYLFSYLINGQREKKGKQEEEENKERKQRQIYPWKKDNTKDSQREN